MLTHLTNMCSHLQNASRARLGVTSVPSTKYTLKLSLALQHAGFLSSVVIGGPQPPQLLTATSFPHATNPADEAEAVVTQENVASRRVWVGLKYYDNMPVLGHLKMESTPRKRVTLKLSDLMGIVRGVDRNYVRGLRSPGECLFVLTDIGLLEAREAVEKKRGGQIICRVQ